MFVACISSSMNLSTRLTSDTQNCLTSLFLLVITTANHSLFTWVVGSSFNVVFVYVDILMIVENANIATIKRSCADRFNIKDLGH